MASHVCEEGDDITYSQIFTLRLKKYLLVTVPRGDTLSLSSTLEQ